MTRPLHRGDVVLVPFPFTDLSASKVRPAVVLTPDPSGPDLIVAYVSSVIPDGPVPASSVLVRPDHPEFPETGLARASLLRLDKLMTVSRTRIHRRLGHLGPVVMAEMDDRLRSAVGL